MRIEANGLSFNVESEGDGTPVLLVHGFPDRARLWRHQIAALAEAGYRAIAPDMRGFGDSDRPEGVENYAILNMLEDLKGILDAFEVDSAHVVGHDWGAATSWAFASLYQDRVKSLTALSVGHPTAFQGAGYEQLARSWYIFMFQFEGVAEEWLSRNDWESVRTWLGGGVDVEQKIADMSRPGALTAGLNWYRANLPPASWISEPFPLPEIAAPTLGVWSSREFALTEKQMVESGKFVSGPWRYERFEDVGHWIPLEAPDRLNALLLEFFEEVGS